MVLSLVHVIELQEVLPIVIELLLSSFKVEILVIVPELLVIPGKVGSSLGLLLKALVRRIHSVVSIVGVELDILGFRGLVELLLLLVGLAELVEVLFLLLVSLIVELLVAEVLLGRLVELEVVLLEVVLLARLIVEIEKSIFKAIAFLLLGLWSELFLGVRVELLEVVLHLLRLFLISEVLEIIVVAIAIIIQVQLDVSYLPLIHLFGRGGHFGLDLLGVHIDDRLFGGLLVG